MNVVKKKSNPKVILIIPAYNEEKNILNVYHAIQKANIPDLDYIVINDGSTDSTEKICQENAIKHITLIENLGIGGCVQTGYRYALENGYDIAVQFDGDGQHDIDYVKDIVQPIQEGKVNFVIGSRFLDNSSEYQSSKIRQLGSKILSGMIQLCVKKKIYDPTSGFRAADRCVIEEFVKNYPVDYPEPETIVQIIQKNYLVEEVPVKINQRQHGKSSITMFKSIYYMTTVCISLLLSNIKGRK